MRHASLIHGGNSLLSKLSTCTTVLLWLVSVKTYYCLWQAVGSDLVFEVEVINPKDNQGDVQEEDRKVKGWVLNDWRVDKRTV